MVEDKKYNEAIAEIEPISDHIPTILKGGKRTYWAIVKFESDENFNKGGLWHLYVRFEDNPSYSQERFLATVSFIAGEKTPQSLQDLLYKGSRFVLLSPDLVTERAKGIIVDMKEN